MHTQKSYHIFPGRKVQFNNACSYCVGTGRMGLALQKEYYEQLALAQKEVGFAYIRGHGLFSDDMAIYNEVEDEKDGIRRQYNFTYLDRIFDMYISLGIRPFLELGFMPEALASGDQTIFYWKGNTTPPKQYALWAELIQALLSHLIDRYGLDEAVSWPIEVWNEPNLPGFWKDADMEEYFTLYEASANAVKEVSPRFRVGGPAICGGETSQTWMKEFLKFCQTKNVPLDFFTRHAYMGNRPSIKGRYLYHTMRPVQVLIDEMRTTREIIDSFEQYRGMELHITEFNTSYHPFCPIHDTNVNAAYIAALLSQLGDVAASYSYWTFGDVFEEQGVPSTPFHGGFGMIANGLIPKPTLWTFAFFNRLKGEALHRAEDSVVVKTENGFTGVCWNLCEGEREERELSFTLAVPDGEYSILYEIVDEEVCNPLKAWHDMGEPSSLTGVQLEFLRRSAVPQCRTEMLAAKNGEVHFTVKLNPYAVASFSIAPSAGMKDMGYEYDWYLHCNSPEHMEVE